MSDKASGDSSSSEEKSALKGERFMRKGERAACWGAKDAFWACMRKSGESGEACTEARRGFESLCPPTWVAHFDRKFQYEKFKDRLATQGYEALDDKFGQAKATRKENPDSSSS